MSSVYSKFEESEVLINDFLRNRKYSIQSKSWLIFKRLGIKDWVTRQQIEDGDFKPWRDPARWGQWACKPEYNISTVNLSWEETKMEWLKLMDHWYTECFQNEYVKIKTCHFFHGVVDVGLFCRVRVGLERLGYEIPGYLDPIDDATCITLKSIGHPSLYEVNEIDENSRYVSNRKKCYVLYGLLSLVNSDTNCRVKFSHRNMNFGLEERLKWDYNFSRFSIRFPIDAAQIDGIIHSVDVRYSLVIDEIRIENDDECEAGEVIVSRSSNVHPVTGLPNLTKQEYIDRVVFGAWVGGVIIQSIYEENFY